MKNGRENIKTFIVPKISPYRIFTYFWKVANEFYMMKFNPDIFHSTYYTQSVLNKKIKIIY